MSKYIVAIIIILVIAVAGALFYSKKSQAPSLSPSQLSSNSSVTAGDGVQIKNLIVYSDSGFSPPSMTIKAGETVMFRNESSRDMWVASAPHPVHTDYPGFDAKKGYKKGEVYSFTFDKIGTWKFHNHLNPTDFGSVAVE